MMKRMVFTYFLAMPFVWIHGYYAGSPSRLSPTDNTGETSIVVEFDNGDWAEIRGPARWGVLECIGEPIDYVDYGDGTDSEDYTI